MNTNSHILQLMMAFHIFIFCFFLLLYSYIGEEKIYIKLENLSEEIILYCLRMNVIKHNIHIIYWYGRAYKRFILQLRSV